MTAPALDGARLRLQRPLDHQLPLFEARQRFKVGRWGRRAGKTRVAWVASIAGHGPGWESFEPLHEGVAHGWDVVWLAPDFPQAGVLWNEEVLPRCEGLEGVIINKLERSVGFEGLGALHVRSYENVRSIRGLGARLKGIVVDEGSHFPLRHAWRSVLRPMLMDNAGWALLMSTTNAGLDGNPEHVAPSFFNQLCLDIQQGRRNPRAWAEFHSTAADNPKISPSEFQELVAEYPADSVELAEEVYAKLLESGAGLAFPEWLEAHHLVSYEPPEDSRWFAGLDWGYAEPCVFVLLAAHGKRNVLARWEYRAQRETPYLAGYTIAQRVRSDARLRRPEWVAADSQMWAVTDGGVTIAEQFQKGLVDGAQGSDPMVLISIDKGPGSRAARKLLLHEGLRYELGKDGKVLPWAGAALRFHRECRSARTIAALPRDRLKSEDVDTRADDHFYDALTYGLMARVPRIEELEVHEVAQDHTPGVDPVLRKRRQRVVVRDPGRTSYEPTNDRGRFATGVRYSVAPASPFDLDPED